MKSLTLHITEALKPGRVWNGKIKNLDNLLSWMYDKDILTKSDKNKKDSLFRQYYRWYNDGDLPRLASSLDLAKSKYGYSKSSEEAIEKLLEEKITEFISSILGKYAGKYDRQQFHIDTYVKALQDVINQLDRDEYGSSFDYWNNKVNIKSEDYNAKVVDAREAHSNFLEVYKAWASSVNPVANPTFSNDKPYTSDYDVNALKNASNYITPYLYRELPVKFGLKPSKEVDKAWEDMVKAFKPVKVFLMNAQTAAKELKQIIK